LLGGRYNSFGQLSVQFCKYARESYNSIYYKGVVDALNPEPRRIGDFDGEVVLVVEFQEVNCPGSVGSSDILPDDGSILRHGVADSRLRS
jgi:hypothetical protein